jgi:hypothetical protein
MRVDQTEVDMQLLGLCDALEPLIAAEVSETHHVRGVTLLTFLRAARESVRLREENARVDRAAAAYVLDRAEQYNNSSGVRAMLEEIAEGLRTGQHREAAAHGELDDLIARMRP